MDNTKLHKNITEQAFNIKEIIKMLKGRLWSNYDNRTLLKNILGNYLIKGGAMIVTLLLVPAYMSFFYSHTLLGMWFTVTITLDWIVMFDFGIGAGVRNQFVQPFQTNNKQVMKEILSAGYIALGVIVLILLILQHFIINSVNLYTLLGIHTDNISPKTLYSMVHILSIGIIIRLFTVLISHVYYAMQKATVPSFLILMANILILLYVKFTVPTYTENDLIKLAIVYACATNIPTVVATIWLFLGKLKGAFPSFKALKWDRVKGVLGIGVGLFFVQMLITLVFGAKELLISWFVAPGQVVHYNIYYKLIGTVSGLFSLALTPIWYAVTKDFVSGNYRRIKKLYAAGTIVIGILGILQFLIVAVMPWLTDIWLGDNKIPISRFYGVIFCFYNVIYMWVMMTYNFSCGLGKIKRMLIYFSLGLLLNIVLAYWWCQLKPSWIMVVLSTSVAVLPAAVFTPYEIFSAICIKGKNVNSNR